MSDTTTLSPSTAPTARDWRRLLAAAPIDDSAKRLVETVVRRTRLWRREKAAVAQELIAHFADAAELGQTPEQAIRAFGDPKTAAKLIRRAKIRNRSYLWHAWRLLRRGIAALLLFYVGVAIYFHAGSPSPNVDYVARLNAPVLATPPDQRGWPFYRQALVAVNQDPMPEASRPDEPGWAETVAWLQRHLQTLELVHQGAAKPTIGFPLQRTLQPEDQAALRGRASTTAPAAPPQPKTLLDDTIISVPLPHLNQLRTLARALAADAMLAAGDGDGERVERNITAASRLSMQQAQEPFLVNQLVGMGIRGIAFRALSNTLERHPQVLSDDALAHLAHAVSGPRTAADLVSYTGERYLFHDLVQRTYTDDGHGDGRFTPEGLRLLREMKVVIPTAQAEATEELWYIGPAEATLGPATLALSASRKELLDEYDSYIDAHEQRLPLSLRDLQDQDPPEQRLERLHQNALVRTRFAFLRTLAPSLNRVQVTAERTLGQQEGVTVAIALELYRRAHGHYPETLQALAPRYLPQVPADRIDGQPLRYVLKDGRPVIYSVGVDRDDDGGRAPLSRDGEPQPHRAAEWTQKPTPIDGDWVLYPSN